MARRTDKFLTVILAIVLPVLVILSCGGDDPVEPKQPPRITAFTASPADILPGDSTLLTYTAQLATSLSLNPGNISLSDLAGGSVWVSPSLPTAYTLAASNSDGVDTAVLNITMSAAVPAFQSFSLLDDTLVVGDSTTLSWLVLRADSILVDNGLGKLPNPASGLIIVKPNVTTSYRAIAFNQIGRDTMNVAVLVHIPQSVQPVGGLYYTGLMGQSAQSPAMSFRVVDQVGLNISSLWIQFSIVEGDGTLSADSALPTNNGTAGLSYDFSGALGHAIVRAAVAGIDSVDVIIRANTLIFGASGQGQYALFGESFAMTKIFNGVPDADTPDPQWPIQYQDYESTLGIVIMITDLNQNNIADDNEPVLGVIVNNIKATYPHKTADSIGIGSHINEVLAIYGTPENIIIDTLTPPPGIAFDYSSKGLTFWTNPPDSIIFEIHLVEPPQPPSLSAGGDFQMEKIGTSSRRNQTYRSYRGLKGNSIAP